MPSGRPVFQPTERQRGQVEAMARYGINHEEAARAIGITKPTLLKHFKEELETGATKAKVQVGEFIFSTIIGMPIPGRPAVTDGRARVAAAIFFAKTQMGWKEIAVIEHKEIDASNARERVGRKLDRIAAAIEASGIFTKPE
jgi:hypothetical protein